MKPFPNIKNQCPECGDPVDMDALWDSENYHTDFYTDCGACGAPFRVLAHIVFMAIPEGVSNVGK